MDKDLKAYLDAEFKKIHDAINELTPTKKPTPNPDAEFEVPRLVKWEDHE